MFEVSMQSDIEDAIKEVGDFFRREIPFVTALTMNDTMFDVKRTIVDQTWPNAFTVRNARFAEWNWRVAPIRVGGRNAASFRGFKSGELDNMFVTLYQRSDGNGGVREWTENHVTGGTKTPRGSHIAVPNKDGMRNTGGSIKKREKPVNITNRKDTFLAKDKSGRKRFIAKRTNNGLDIIYQFVKQAQIKPKFKFYEDAFETIDNRLMTHWDDQVNRVIKRSRFD